MMGIVIEDDDIAMRTDWESEKMENFRPGEWYWRILLKAYYKAYATHLKRRFKLINLKYFKHSKFAETVNWIDNNFLKRTDLN